MFFLGFYKCFFKCSFYCGLFAFGLLYLLFDFPSQLFFLSYLRLDPCLFLTIKFISNGLLKIFFQVLNKCLFFFFLYIKTNTTAISNHIQQFLLAASEVVR